MRELDDLDAREEHLCCVLRSVAGRKSQDSHRGVTDPAILIDNERYTAV